MPQLYKVTIKDVWGMRTSTATSLSQCKWRYGDTNPLSPYNPLRWSEHKSLEQTALDLRMLEPADLNQRPVILKIPPSPWAEEQTFETAEMAADALEDKQESCEWMFADSRIGGVARFNPFKWSDTKGLEATARDLRSLPEMEKTRNGRPRPVILKVPAGMFSQEQRFDSVDVAVEELEKKRNGLVPLNSGDSSEVQVVVEFQVGDVLRQTELLHVRVRDAMMEGGLVQFDKERLALEPILIPAIDGQEMKVRLHRMGYADGSIISSGVVALGSILEGEVVASAGAEIELPKLQGQKDGIVSLGISTMETVLSFESAPSTFIPDPIAAVGLRPTDYGSPLLHNHDNSWDIGRVVVKIKRFQKKDKHIEKLRLKLALEGEEQDATRTELENTNASTFEFSFGSLQSSLHLYCHDDASSPEPLGRILIPLTDVCWNSGDAPKLLRVCKAMSVPVCKRPRKYSKEYVAQFMPLGKGKRDGQGKPEFNDRFKPLLKKQAESGMWKSKVFGRVELELEVSLTDKTRSPLYCYYKSMIAGGRPRKIARLEHTEKSFWELVNSFEGMGTVQRAIDRIVNFFKRPSQGTVRWLKESKGHGVLAGVLWWLFCWFPTSVDMQDIGVPKQLSPPLWGLPFYLWALVLLNGVMASRYRQRVWADDAQLAFDVWNEDVEAPPPMPASAIVKVIDNVRRGTIAVGSLLERASNAFDFADGAASILVFTATFFVALALCLVGFLWSWADSNGVWSFPIIGFAICFCISGPKKNVDRESEDRDMGAEIFENNADVDPSAALLAAKKGDPLKALLVANRILQCIPDQSEVAHRYIATKVQCKTIGPSTPRTASDDAWPRSSGSTSV